jgi:hypothetical protein
LKKAAFLIFIIMLLAAPALAQYDIHLKNGSVIKGVGSYQEVDGQIFFRYAGGMVAIPAGEVKSIEESREGGRVLVPGEAGPSPEAQRPREAPKPPQMPPDTTGAQREIENRIAEIDRRLQEIAKEEKGYRDMEDEYNSVRLRIEVLFQKGIAEARKEGGDPAKWFEFLPPQERKWAQLNTLKKNKLGKELPEKRQEIEPLLGEKRVLLEEKQRLQEELNRLRRGF